MISLWSVNILLIFGTVVALLVSTSSQMQMVSASVEGGTPGSNTSNSNQGAPEGCSPMDPRCNTDVNCAVNPGDPACHGAEPASSSSGDSSNPNQEAVNHINLAQSALQNGDTAGAQMHMDAAKQALGCNKIIDPNC